MRKAASSPLFSAWADETGLGRVGTEWEFRVTPPGERIRSLVPDVAYLSFERLPYEDEGAAQMPHLAPDIAIEILSPSDHRTNVDEKIRVYLSSGTKAVIEIDPQAHSATIHDIEGTRTLGKDDNIKHPALPDFSMPVASIFARTRPRI